MQSAEPPPAASATMQGSKCPAENTPLRCLPPQSTVPACFSTVHGKLLHLLLPNPSSHRCHESHPSNHLAATVNCHAAHLLLAAASCPAVPPAPSSMLLPCQIPARSKPSLLHEPPSCTTEAAHLPSHLHLAAKLAAYIATIAAPPPCAQQLHSIAAAPCTSTPPPKAASFLLHRSAMAVHKLPICRSHQGSSTPPPWPPSAPSSTATCRALPPPQASSQQQSKLAAQHPAVRQLQSSPAAMQDSSPPCTTPLPSQHSHLSTASSPTHQAAAALLLHRSSSKPAAPAASLPPNSTSLLPPPCQPHSTKSKHHHAATCSSMQAIRTPPSCCPTFLKLTCQQFFSTSTKLLVDPCATLQSFPCAQPLSHEAKLPSPAVPFAFHMEAIITTSPTSRPRCSPINPLSRPLNIFYSITYHFLFTLTALLCL